MLLKSVRVQGVGCVKDATLTLTPLHALIGPNDAGKSTLLRALQAALAAASDGTRLAAAASAPSASVEVYFPEEVMIRASQAWPALFVGSEQVVSNHPVGSERQGESLVRLTGNKRLAYAAGAGEMFASGDAIPVECPTLRLVAEWMAAPAIVRLDPDALRKRTSLLGTGAPRFSDARGTGLPGVLDAIRDRDDSAWSEIQKQVRALFPTVKQLRVSAVSAHEKEVATVLNDGTVVAAEHMSEGMLYVLGILAIVHGAPTSMVLMEEPENGLHPARIREVMGLLRKLSETVPVLLATHSPLVVNELEANEVTVVTRDDEGTHATLLSNTKDYASRSRAYENGELWLSYGDAEREKDLVSGAE